MCERADVEEGLDRIHQFRELVLHDLAVHVFHFNWEPGHTLERMQHYEPGARRPEVGFGNGTAVESQVAVPGAFDAGVVRDLLFGALAHRVEGNRKTVGALVDLQIADGRRVGAPVLVSYQKADRAQHFDAVDLEVAQLTVVELDRHRPGLEYSSRRVRLFGSAQRDRL